MDNNDDENRRMRDECDGHEDIRATVRKAQSFVDMNIMSEAEALKYFNLPKAVYEKFKDQKTV